MSTVTYYDPGGRLLEVFSYTNEETKAINVAGKLFVEGNHDGATHYILNGEVTERPASPVSRTDLTLHDVPVGSTLVINGDSYAAKGTVELEFPMPDVYSLRVECFPYLDWVDEVTV